MRRNFAVLIPDRFGLAIGLLFATLSVSIACAGQPGEAGFEALLNGRDLSGWKIYVDPLAKNPTEQPWSVRDGLLVCEGSTKGYLATEREFGDFVLKLQWRWGEKTTRPGRYSSAFVRVTGPDKIWPKGLDATLSAGAAGQFWLVGGYELKVDPSRRDPKSDRHYFALVPNADRPIGEWNEMEIDCNGGSVRVSINGKLVNEGSDASPRKGRIVLLSEGAEILFRKIEIKE